MTPLHAGHEEAAVLTVAASFVALVAANLLLYGIKWMYARRRHHGRT